MFRLLLTLAWASWTIQAFAEDAPAKPASERVLKGLDATQASVLQFRIRTASALDQQAEVVRLSEQLVELRTRVQGANHWETVDEIAVLEMRRKVAALTPDERAKWTKSIRAGVEAQRLYSQGAYAAAQSLGEEHQRACAQLLGEKSSLTATSYDNLGQALSAQGKFTEAQPLLQKALDFRVALLGEEHPAVAISLNNLANNLAGLGKQSEAQRLLEQALAVRRKVLGEKHADVAVSLSNLATNLQSQAKYISANEHFEQALQLQLELLGERNSNTAMMLDNLADNLRAQGRLDEAQVRSQRALDIRRSLYGDNHPDVALSYNNLAAILVAQGRIADAQPLYQKALELQRKLLGENHPETAVGYNNVASALNLQGKYAEAQAYFQRSLELNRSLLGDLHPQTARSLSNLGSNLKNQGKNAESHSLILKALEIRRKTLGERHADTAHSYSVLANSFSDQREHAKAQPLFELALGLNRDLYGENHPQTALSYSNLAMNLASQQEFDQARSFAQTAIDLNVELLGPHHPQTAHSWYGFADILHGQKDFSQAEEFSRKATENQRAVLGDLHPDLSLGYGRIGSLLMAQAKYEAARSWLLKSTGSYEAARLNVANEGLERGIFGARVSPYQALAATELRLGNPMAAWTAVETDLARGLSDEAGSRNGTGLTTAEQERLSAIALRLTQIQSRLSRFLSKGVGSQVYAEELAKLQAERTQLESERSEFGIRRSQREVATLAEIQAKLPADGALIMWVDVSDQVGGVQEHWGCVIRQKGMPLWEPLTGAGSDGKWTESDDALPRQLRSALVSGTTSAAELHPLVERLRLQRLVPLTRHLTEVRTLYVVPVREMASLPLELFATGFSVVYVPSGSFLARQKQERPPQDNRLLAVGDPTFHRKINSPQARADLPSVGLLIMQIAPGGIAARARMQAGDVITHYGGIEITSVEKLSEAIQASLTAKEISVTLWRQDADRPIVRVISAGPLGVFLSKQPAREAIAFSRELDQVLSPLSDGDWKDLPGTRVELTQLSQLFATATTELSGSAAREQKLDELRKNGELAKYRFLHFATHGEANSDRALESVLILAQDALPVHPLPMPGEPFLNGQLSANEVRRFWKLDAELVTLSACETALGRDGGGDGMLGFAQAFLLAGSRSVCLSLWKVDDTATALLMDRFYRNLLGKREDSAKPMGKAAALHEAKNWLKNLKLAEATDRLGVLTDGVSRGSKKGREVIGEVPAPKDSASDSKPYSHPKYWAAFILIGAPD